ncbi:family 78 glycoside hydrolase catalytic domain [Cellvibrio polysaccharolyticus]|uniref:alpha-L-rhamnosidase n=1 Tax=Cellvibrio polysaccharolyticus TaxID=2082724 RepID=A0A928YWJ7_9GAMM|nr:family 78 glycoside hydrolase catalytic domain [Cellvibrio polysaccharolyticus]MBE8718273.1 alpha-L-rhamnosidase [Cellvibrio polysaccharolyticus]
MKRWFLSTITALCLLAGATLVHAAGLQVYHLETENTVNPTGIDRTDPRLYWRLKSEDAGQKQTAWQILVASSEAQLQRNRGDLWDSGKQNSSKNIHVHYAGKPIKSSQQVFWKVKVWDRDGKASDWSETSSWTMGVLSQEEWKGVWITPPQAMESALLRKNFVVNKGLKSAVLHAVGLGTYDLHLNGSKLGEDLLSPGWTNFDKTALYSSWDITEQLQEGDNALGFMLGNGMYNVVPRNRFSKFAGSFGPLRANLHLQLEYANGKTEFFGTDESWKAHTGPWVFNSIYGGEDYDARALPAGWSTAAFDDRAWLNAVIIMRPKGELKGQSVSAEPIRIIETRQPKAVQDFADGTRVYDLGQNTTWMPRIRVRGPAGSTVRLTPSEITHADGTINRDTTGLSHRGSAWWQYTKATDEDEEWAPHFYYVGSRYLKLDVFPADPHGLVPTSAQVPARKAGDVLPELLSVEGLLVHSIASPVGEFSAANPLLNQIRDLVRWAQRSNIVSVLTDCPHREKLGWLEQYHLNGPSIRYEFDMARVFTKSLRDMRDSQTEEGALPNIAPEYVQFKGTFRHAAEWGASLILVPWQQYQFEGDTDLLREYYPAMKAYFAHLKTRADDYILSEGLGDWYDLGPEKPGKAQLTFPDLTATAFLFYDASVLAKIADVLHEKADAENFRNEAAAIRKKFNSTFFNEEKGYYAGNSQAANALPLELGLVEESQRDRVFANLVQDVIDRDYAMTAGDVGFRFLLQALSNGGRADVIYRMINQSDKPGYGYQIKKGATALTESWDANHTASHNHFMLGHIIEWFYKDLVGIGSSQDEPGFKKIRLYPQPVRELGWAQATYQSVQGPISARWDFENNGWRYRVTIPANTTAEVHLPGKGEVTLNGKPVTDTKTIEPLPGNGLRQVYRVPSGSYDFFVANE